MLGLRCRQEPQLIFYILSDVFHNIDTLTQIVAPKIDVKKSYLILVQCLAILIL